VIKRYCPLCHSTEGFKLEGKVSGKVSWAILVCTHCGYKCEVEAVIRECLECSSEQPHVAVRKEVVKTIWAYVCLSCGIFVDLGNQGKGE